MTTVLTCTSFGGNPQGLLPYHIWQINVTHVTEFGKLRYVHVTIDTYSGFLMLTAQTGEFTKYAITHCLKCFPCMGAQIMIKMDNGSGYVSRAFEQFCTQYIRPIFLIILKNKEL